MQEKQQPEPSIIEHLVGMTLTQHAKKDKFFSNLAQMTIENDKQGHFLNALSSLTIAAAEGAENFAEDEAFLLSGIKEQGIVSTVMDWTMQEHADKQKFISQLTSMTLGAHEAAEEQQSKIMSTFSHMHTLVHQKETASQQKIMSTLNYMNVLAHDDEADQLEFYAAHGINMGVF